MNVLKIILKNRLVIEGKIANCVNLFQISPSFYHVLRFNNNDCSSQRKDAEFIKNKNAVNSRESTLTPRNEAYIYDKDQLKSHFVINDIDVASNEKKFKTKMNALNRRSYRERKEKIVLEGLELIHWALENGLKLENFFYSKDNFLHSLSHYKQLKGIHAYKVSNSSIKKLRNDEHNSGIIAISQKPKLDSFKKEAIPVTVLCSDIRDPDNLGKILTISAAAGCKKVVLLKGCVDAWDRKVLNCSNGAHFLLPIVNNVNWPDVLQCLPENSALYLADSSSDLDMGITQFYIEGKSQTPEEKLMYPRNMALPVFEQDEVMLPPVDDENLPCRLYTEIAFPKRDLVVYMGGETVGINNHAYELARELQGQKIKLPLENEMDSLNVCVALSVILFEIQRQFTKTGTYVHNAV